MVYFFNTMEKQKFEQSERPLDIRKSEEKQEEWWRKYLVPRDSQSVEEYLYQAPRDMGDDAFLDSFLLPEKNKNKILPDDALFEKELFEQIGLLLQKNPERMTKKLLRENLIALKDEIHTLTNRIQNAEDKNTYFAQTNTDRPLREGSEDEETILYHLFGIGPVYAFDKVKTIFEKRINGKNIVLLGGGNSIMDLLTQATFTPKSVINIDPYLTTEPIDKNTRGLYYSIPIAAENPEMVSEFKKVSPVLADEIWATYSVPCYLETREDIFALFQNIDGLLAKNGTARIYPLSLANFTHEAGNVFNAEGYRERESAWIDALIPLLETGKYNLNVFNGVMHLQKLG